MILNAVIIVMCILGIALIIAGVWLMTRRTKRSTGSEQAQGSTEARVPGIGVEVSLPPPAVLLAAGTVLLVVGGSLAVHTASANGTPKPNPTTFSATPTIIPSATSSSPPPSSASPSPIDISLKCSLNTRSPHPGMTVKMTYNISINQGDVVGLGAGIYDNSGNDHSTGYGDIDSIQLSAGQITESRPVPIPSRLSSGRYEIDAEIWPRNEVGRNEANTIADATCGYFSVQ
jgi:hypothetical protein